ncbi:MAG: DUF4366 domain-containing protein [Defluviitaleaceae bacterium]|nr:DUF4366 domain-containing protein [Defluviitaleaceae bacterium]
MSKIKFLSFILIIFLVDFLTVSTYANQVATEASEEISEELEVMLELEGLLVEHAPSEILDWFNQTFDATFLEDVNWNDTTPPLSITGQRFDGGGTLVDYIRSGNRDFLTVVSRQGNVFYIIIDYDKEENNVYFLTEVDQNALIFLDDTQEAGGQAPTITQANQPQQRSIAAEQLEPPPDEEPAQEGRNVNMTLVLSGAVLIIVVAYGYYTKIYKKKRQRKPGTVNEEIEKNQDDEYLDDELLYEDDDLDDD